MVLSGPILITGGSGQLATALAARAGTRNIRHVGRPEWDYDRLDTLPALLRATAPSIIINAAAYTAVDRAETDADAAHRANADAPRILADYAAAADIPLIHVSTDYVFDGTKSSPYIETDDTNPTGIYGRTKLAGEQAILATSARAIILRTAWVYSATGKNFLLTMLNAAAKTNHLRVVADQAGCPTAAADLAQVILRIADRIAVSGWHPTYAGIFHAAGTGPTTWHGFATAIFEDAAKHGRPLPTVDPITTADYPTPATRPANSRLDCGKLAKIFGMALPHWRTSVTRTITDVLTPR